MDDFADRGNLERYLVVPNMFSCISLHSTLGSKPKDYAEYYLMFKLYRVIEMKKKKFILNTWLSCDTRAYYFFYCMHVVAGDCSAVKLTWSASLYMLICLEIIPLCFGKWYWSNLRCEMKSNQYFDDLVPNNFVGHELIITSTHLHDYIGLLIISCLTHYAVVQFYRWFNLCCPLFHTE